jgi:pimeloyl-ACP methyl ester carboxylesterase
MPACTHNEKPNLSQHLTGGASLDRRQLLKRSLAFAGTLAMSAGLQARAGSAFAAPRASIGESSAAPPNTPQPLDAKAEAEKIAFDRVGSGEKLLMISGFPETRLSWNKLTPLLSQKFECVAADLPSFGDSGILAAPATTENVGRVFHEFVAAKLAVPLDVVAHDFGAWCAYSWALLFPGDFKSLTLMEAGIPGVTLTSDVQVSDYKRKWQFIFQMLPELPAELTKGKEDVYVGWWFKNKVYKPGAVPQADVDAYVRAFAREGRMDAAFDYCRKIIDDMEFNKRQFKSKLRIRLLAVGGQYSIPQMGDSLRPYFENVTSVVIPDSGHFVPEEQPQALAKALLAFL